MYSRIDKAKGSRFKWQTRHGTNKWSFSFWFHQHLRKINGSWAVLCYFHQHIDTVTLSVCCLVLVRWQRFVYQSFSEGRCLIQLDKESLLALTNPKQCAFVCMCIEQHLIHCHLAHCLIIIRPYWLIGLSSSGSRPIRFPVKYTLFQRNFRQYVKM